MISQYIKLADSAKSRCTLFVLYLYLTSSLLHNTTRDTPGRSLIFLLFSVDCGKYSRFHKLRNELLIFALLTRAQMTNRLFYR